MTLTDIKTDLFNFFGSHDSFSIEENFDQLSELNIIISKEEKPLMKALIVKALESFEEQKIVVKIDILGKKQIWILDKPLAQYSQTLELSAPVLLLITKLINDYCDQVKNQEAKVDPLNIQERDINSLLLIINQLLKE